MGVSPFFLPERTAGQLGLDSSERFVHAHCQQERGDCGRGNVL